ncbi:hypothetical protein ACLK15_16625 [Escherichia coli]
MLGGKTSLLFWLAELLQASGRRVLITTTTHMFMPTSHWPVVFCGRSRHASSCISRPHFILFSQLESEPGKSAGIYARSD